MSELPDFAAVIFDLDGLVLDTEPTYFAAWQQAAAQMGFASARAFWTSLSGLQAGAVAQCLQAKFGEGFDVQRFAALSGQCWREAVEQQGIAIKPGFQQLLGLLNARQIPFALATNSPLVNARECLALAGLQAAFACVVARDHVQAGKPAPDIFLLAAQQLNIPIDSCLVLEDSYAGVLAAHRAGARVVYIPSNAGDPKAAALADRQFASLTSLAGML